MGKDDKGKKWNKTNNTLRTTTKTTPTRGKTTQEERPEIDTRHDQRVIGKDDSRDSRRHRREREKNDPLKSFPETQSPAITERDDLRHDDRNRHEIVNPRVVIWILAGGRGQFIRK